VLQCVAVCDVRCDSQFVTHHIIGVGAAAQAARGGAGRSGEREGRGGNAAQADGCDGRPHEGVVEIAPSVVCSSIVFM